MSTTNGMEMAVAIVEMNEDALITGDTRTHKLPLRDVGAYWSPSRAGWVASPRILRRILTEQGFGAGAWVRRAIESGSLRVGQ